VTRKGPAYGGEAAAARLRYSHMRHVHQDDVSCAVAGDSGHKPYLSEGAAQAFGEALGLLPVQCEHPATYVARVCVSCDTIMEMQP